jgi:RNA polymerase I-specific transcription initiation factor RRN5
MSSGDEDEIYSPPRRRSSTPNTPRKRRRLDSLRIDTAGLRKHDILRKREVEASYSDEYRVLFNEQVTQAASRFDLEQLVQYYTKQVGSSIWSPQEQALFFAALERLGKDDLPGIAEAVGTKSDVEARDFLLVLQDAAAKHRDAKVTLRDIPAAIELGDACSQKLEEAGDALAWYQERFEAEQEQERYGKYWLITPSVAEEIEDSINGLAPSRPASASGEREPSRFGKGVAGYDHG